MFGINKNGIKHKIGIIMPSFFPSSRTLYDNTSSGLAATNVQDAIDEISTVKNGNTRVTVINDTSGTTNNQQTVTMTKNGYVWIQAAQSSSDIYCGFSLRVNGLDVFGVWQDGQGEAKPYRTYCFSFPVYKGDVVRFILNHAKGSCGYVEYATL